MQKLVRSIARQPKLANGNIPYHRCHAQFMNEDWPGAAIFFFLTSRSSNPLSSGSLNLLGSWIVFRSFMKFIISGFCDRCLGTICKLVNGWWEKYIVYSLFYILIIIIISSSISISVSFVVSLNFLYFSPWVLPFVHFFFLFCWGRRGVVSGSRVLLAGCQLRP